MWRLDPVMEIDKKIREASMSTIIEVMFDGSPDVMKHVQVLGDPGLSRSYRLLDIPDQHRTMAGLQLRRLIELGKAVLMRFKSRMKYDLMIKTGIDRDRQLVTKVDYEFPADAMCLELIIAKWEYQG
jgi:hypothetical protein